jgi:membrane-associated phospholipid phosphatase
MRALLILITFICIAFNAFSADKSFDVLRPVDEPISKALAWDDHELPAKLSDYGLYASIAMPYVYVVTEKEDRLKRFGSIAATQFTAMLLSDVVKMRSKRVRPNGQDDRSFFSGHSSMSFASSGLVCLMGNKYHCYGSVALAGVTAYLRVAAKKHYASDILVGAGLGYLNGRYYPKLFMRF